MKTRGPVAGILVAATRGSDGSHLPIADADSIEAAIHVLASTKIDQLVVMLGEPAGTVAFHMAAPTTTVKRDKEWTTGLGGGLRGGVEALQPDAVAILITTVDIVPEDGRALRRAIRRYHRGESDCFIFERDGRVGLPALLDRRCRALLLEAQSEAELIDRIRQREDGCEVISVTSPSPEPATE